MSLFRKRRKNQYECLGVTIHAGPANRQTISSKTLGQPTTCKQPASQPATSLAVTSSSQQQAANKQETTGRSHADVLNFPFRNGGGPAIFFSSVKGSATGGKGSIFTMKPGTYDANRTLKKNKESTTKGPHG